MADKEPYIRFELHALHVATEDKYLRRQILHDIADGWSVAESVLANARVGAFVLENPMLNQVYRVFAAQENEHENAHEDRSVLPRHADAEIHRRSGGRVQHTAAARRSGVRRVRSSTLRSS